MDRKRMTKFDTRIVVFGVVVLITALIAGCNTSTEQPEAEAARPDSPDPTVPPTLIATVVATKIPVTPTTTDMATDAIAPVQPARPTATDTPVPGQTIVNITSPPNLNWNWQLTSQLDMSVNVDVWDVDMFETEPDKIAELQQDGRYVICYFSAGSMEDWRPDIGVINQAAIGLPLDGWPGERWLDVRDESTLQMVELRMSLAQQKDCNAVEPDNVDGFSNATGFPLSASDQIQFNLAFAQLAHDRGLAVGLKNSLDIAHALAEKFDFAVTEECHTYDECELLSPFLDLNKPVFNAEYPGSEAAGLSNKRVDCQEANRLGIHTLFLPVDLDGTWRVTCD